MLYWFADGVRTAERKKGLSFGCPPVFEAIYLQYSQSSSSLSFSVDIDCAATYQFFANQQSRWQKARPTPMWFIFNTAIERHLTWGKVFRQLHPTRWCICFLYSFQGNFIDPSLLLPLLRPRANKLCLFILSIPIFMLKSVLPSLLWDWNIDYRWVWFGKHQQESSVGSISQWFVWIIKLWCAWAEAPPFIFDLSYFNNIWRGLQGFHAICWGLWGSHVNRNVICRLINLKLSFSFWTHLRYESFSTSFIFLSFWQAF